MHKKQLKKVKEEKDLPLMSKECREKKTIKSPCKDKRNILHVWERNKVYTFKKGLKEKRYREEYENYQSYKIPRE